MSQFSRQSSWTIRMNTVGVNRPRSIWSSSGPSYNATYISSGVNGENGRNFSRARP